MGSPQIMASPATIEPGVINPSKKSRCSVVAIQGQQQRQRQQWQQQWRASTHREARFGRLLLSERRPLCSRRVSSSQVDATDLSSNQKQKMQIEMLSAQIPRDLSCDDDDDDDWQGIDRQLSKVSTHRCARQHHTCVDGGEPWHRAGRGSGQAVLRSSKMLSKPSSCVIDPKLERSRSLTTVNLPLQAPLCSL